MNKKIEKCQIAGKQINSAHDLIDNGLTANTLNMQYLNCEQRPRENGGPASLPLCRQECPFHKIIRL